MLAEMAHDSCGRRSIYDIVPVDLRDKATKRAPRPADADKRLSAITTSNVGEGFEEVVDLLLEKAQECEYLSPMRLRERVEELLSTEGYATLRDTPSVPDSVVFSMRWYCARIGIPPPFEEMWFEEIHEQTDDLHSFGAIAGWRCEDVVRKLRVAWLLDANQRITADLDRRTLTHFPPDAKSAEVVMKSPAVVMHHILSAVRTERRALQ